MNRENEIWFNNLGSMGIRRDVLQGKADESVLFDCLNLDTLSVSGEIRKIRGSGELVMSALSYTATGFTPGIGSVSIINVEGDNYLAGVGVQGGQSSTSRMFFEALESGSVTSPVCIFECPTPELLSAPASYAGGAVTPRGALVPPVITSYIDIEVDDTTLDDELDYTGVVHREAKTGFPFTGFVHHNGVNNNANWFAPFATGTEATTDRFDDVVVTGGTPANRTQVGAQGFGCVGTASTTESGITFGQASSVLCQFTAVPGSDNVWEYGYSNSGDGGAIGWGYKHGAGGNTYRLNLRWAALGYVYVYADGTTSEMFVLRWKNEFTSAGTTAQGGPANLGAPVSINQRVDTGGVFNGNTNLCVIAWKVRCRIPAYLLSDHTVIGVRVFYSHRSTAQDDLDYNDPSAYNGWTSDQDIFSGMRECMYIDEDDAKVGYCRIESAEYHSISGETDGATLQCAYFNYVLCPCEQSVAQYAEIVSDMPNVSIKNPMTLGRLWGEIRGEIDSQTGVLADLSDGRITVQVIENNQVIKSYASDDSADGGTAFTTRSSPAVNNVSFVQPRTAINSFGCFSQVGRLWHWGVQVVGERKVDWFSLYPSHIDQNSLPHPSIARLDLQVPIRLGEIRMGVALGRDAIIGTTAGIAILSFGSGLPSEWSRRVLDTDVSIERPGMMRAIGSSCYIVGTDGHIYLYLDGASELVRITGQLVDSDDNIILPAFALDGESYPTNHVFNGASIAYHPEDERVVVCYRYNWQHVLTLCYDIKTKAFLRMSRFFVAASNTLGGRVYISTGSSVMGLFGDNFAEHDDGGHGTVVGGYGEIGDSPAESVDQHWVIDKLIHEIGDPEDWEDVASLMVGWSEERIRLAVAGLPPGGSLFYQSFGWVTITTYDPEYSAIDLTGQFQTTDPLYDTGGKFSVAPDLFWYAVNPSEEPAETAMPWILTFDKMISHPGNRGLITGFMIHGTISDTFTVKFYCDGSATAEQTLTIAGVTGWQTVRVWVPFEISVRVDIRSTNVVKSAPFSIRMIGIGIKEGSRRGQKR